MRAGVLVSIIGHVGAVLMTLLAWEVSSTLPGNIVTVVPIEIVDVAVEANVRALAEDVPDEEVAPQEEQIATEEEPAPAPTPTPQPQRRQRNDDFSLADISGMINRERETGRRREEGQSAETTRRGAGLGTAEVASLEARAATLARQHLIRCWRSTEDVRDPERLQVTLAIRLNRDGSLNGQPRVIRPTGNYTFDQEMNDAVNRALRAVRTCEPVSRLPEDPVVGEHYEIWRDQEVHFGLGTPQ